jgi:outer membrane protein, multidrug efflux system
MIRYPAFRRLTTLAGAAMLAACASLPPEQTPLARRDAHSVDIERVAGTPAGAWPETQWWTRYGDAQLDTLLERALEDAPSMAMAAARFRLAESSTAVARAQLGANVDLQAAVTREKLSHHGLIPPPYSGTTISDTEINLGFSYDFDWWGKNRATLAAAIDEQHAAEADRAAAALLLTSAVAQQYFSWQAWQARSALAQALLEKREQLVHLLHLRVERGLEASISVDQAASQRDATRQTLALLQTNRDLTLEQLRNLVGAAPGTLAPLTPTPLPVAEAGVPPQLGLDLLARRPDVEASRLRIEAQIQRIDSAKAQFYPDFNINAFLGLSSVELSKLFDKDSLTTGITPALHLPIFDAGRLRANLGVTRANLDIDIASYNQTVIDAAADVAFQASTLQGITAQHAAALAALQSDRAVRADVDTLIHQGLADARDAINAEVPLVLQQDILLQLDAQRLVAQVALIKALGGGYSSIAPDALGDSRDHTAPPSP